MVVCLSTNLQVKIDARCFWFSRLPSSLAFAEHIRILMVICNGFGQLNRLPDKAVNGGRDARGCHFWADRTLWKNPRGKTLSRSSITIIFFTVRLMKFWSQTIHVIFRKKGLKDAKEQKSPEASMAVKTWTEAVLDCRRVKSSITAGEQNLCRIQAEISEVGPEIFLVGMCMSIWFPSASYTDS